MKSYRRWWVPTITIIQQKLSKCSHPSSSKQYFRSLIYCLSWLRPKMVQSKKMPKTRQKCLQLSILSYLGLILPSAKRKEGRMPHQQRPADRAPFKRKQQGIWQYLRAKLAKTKVRTVWNTTWAAAICLFFYILKPALLQSSQQIQRMPQKCWCCQAIIYINMANGSTMQQLLPDAIHPKYTGRLPTTEPTMVFHSDWVFILVQTKRQPAQMVAPTIAVIGLQLQSPNIPRVPRVTPLIKAYLGGMPSTNGLCEVLTIFLSYQISMYWLSD